MHLEVFRYVILLPHTYIKYGPVSRTRQKRTRCLELTRTQVPGY